MDKRIIVTDSCGNCPLKTVFPNQGIVNCGHDDMPYVSVLKYPDEIHPDCPLDKHIPDLAKNLDRAIRTMTSIKNMMEEQIDNKVRGKNIQIVRTFRTALDELESFLKEMEG